MAEVAYKVRIYGRVTGVGFRYSAFYKAAAFPAIKGYVRNVDCDQVEALVQGNPEEVDEIVSWMRKGPALARVDNIEIDKTPARPDLHSFKMM